MSKTSLEKQEKLIVALEDILGASAVSAVDKKFHDKGTKVTIIGYSCQLIAENEDEECESYNVYNLRFSAK